MLQMTMLINQATWLGGGRVVMAVAAQTALICAGTIREAQDLAVSQIIDRLRKCRNRCGDDGGGSWVGR